jgi:type III restriction enzyme
MREHFETLYKEPYESTLYDSKDLIKVKNFATSNNIQIMVLNIQSFQRSENIMNQVTDDLEGEIPIKLLQSTRPIVIVDEPQNMETEISSQAINKLNFLCTLRYSATHKNPYNLIYKLDPITAYNLKLVKQIEVASVIADKNFNDAFIELKQINNKSDLKAQVLINISINKNIQQKNIWVKRDDDLFFKSRARTY